MKKQSFANQIFRYQKCIEYVLKKSTCLSEHLIFNIVTISYAFLPAIKRGLHAALVTICHCVSESQLLWWHFCYENVACAVHLSSSQTDGSQKVPNLNYTVDVLGHSSQHWQCTPWSSNWYGAWCYCVARENLSSLMWLWVGLQLSQCHDKQSELVVCLDSRKSQKITPFLSPKTVHITLPTDGFVLNFFSDEFPTCHSMDCCLDSSS